MTKTIYLMPRRSGKTTLAEYEFCKDPKNTMFIGYNERMLDHIESYKLNNHNFFTQHDNLKGYKFEKAVIDEYTLFDLKGLKELYFNLELIGIKELFVFSTGVFVEIELFELVKSCKKQGYSWKSQEAIKGIWPESFKLKIETSADNRDLINTMDKLQYSFLTDPDTNVIYKPNSYKTRSF